MCQLYVYYGNLLVHWNMSRTLRNNKLVNRTFVKTATIILFFFLLFVDFSFTFICGFRILKWQTVSIFCLSLKGVPVTAYRVAQWDLEAGLILQERQEGDISNDDNSKSLCLALQNKEDILHGQVRLYIYIDKVGFHWL